MEMLHLVLSWIFFRQSCASSLQTKWEQQTIVLTSTQTSHLTDFHSCEDRCDFSRESPEGATKHPGLPVQGLPPALTALATTLHFWTQATSLVSEGVMKGHNQ